MRENLGSNVFLISRNVSKNVLDACTLPLRLSHNFLKNCTLAWNELDLQFLAAPSEGRMSQSKKFLFFFLNHFYHLFLFKKFRTFQSTSR